MTETFITKRPTVSAMENILGQEFTILDHGFIRVVDYMGGDDSVVQAARVSYGTGTKKISEDRGLIRYLMRHRHSTPFEMAELKIHVKLPIFVARQWIRHRTASVNEYSARYSVLDKEFYIPKIEHVAKQSTVNNQGRDEVLDPDTASKVMALLKEDALECYGNYEHLISDKVGLARELARINLPMGMYTQWYWKVNLHNLMHFVALRVDPHAQYEIRVYAEKLLDILRLWVPHTAEAFEEYRLGAFTFSKTMMDVIKRQLSGETVTQETSGLTKREWTEFQSALKV